MAKRKERARKVEARAEERPRERVSEATEELFRSLCRLGVAVLTSPFQLLPRETRRHLRAAGRETIRAGIALERGALQVIEERLDRIEARLEEWDAELEREAAG